MQRACGGGVSDVGMKEAVAEDAEGFQPDAEGEGSGSNPTGRIPLTLPLQMPA
jgi:hypothetical protein